MVGDMYCKKPILDKGILFVAFANQSKGVAVATPEHNNKIVVFIEMIPMTPIPCPCRKSMYPKAKGIRIMVSSANPTNDETFVIF